MNLLMAVLLLIFYAKRRVVAYQVYCIPKKLEIFELENYPPS